MNKNIAFSVFVFGILLMAGCSGGSSSGGAGGPGGKQLTIGFSQIGAESRWRTAETNSVKDAAKQLGVNLKFADANEKQENQINAIHTFIDEHVDGIILAPVVETGWGPVLREAKQAHIPVVLVDRGIKVNDDSLYYTLVGSNFIQEGKRACDALARAMNDKGNVVIIEGTPGSAAAVERSKGFLAELTKYPNMKILLTDVGDFTQTKGKQVMEAILKAQGKNINGVFAQNDDMGLGAIQAIEEAGLTPGKDIKLVTVDGTAAGLKAIIAGKIFTVVECNPLLGPDAFAAMKNAIAGKPSPKKILIVDQVFNSSNAARLLPERKY